MVGMPGHMNLDQLKAVYKAGWDVGNHTIDHAGFNSYEDQKSVSLWS